MTEFSPRRDVEDHQIENRIREGALDGDPSMTIAWAILRAVERIEVIWELAESRRRRGAEESRGT